jgi:hypothetical protein
MWLTPFETLSLLRFTCSEIRGHYSRPSQTTHLFEEESEPWNDQEWFRKRPQVLLAQNTLFCAGGALVASYQALWEASREANGNPQRAAPKPTASILNSYKTGDGNLTMENPKESWGSLKD